MKTNSFGFGNANGYGSPVFGTTHGNGGGSPNSRSGGGFGNGGDQSKDTGDGRSRMDGKYVFASWRHLQEAIELAMLRV